VPATCFGLLGRRGRGLKENGKKMVWQKNGVAKKWCGKKIGWQKNRVAKK
jgi:hypothetical protein